MEQNYVNVTACMDYRADVVAAASDRRHGQVSRLVAAAADPERDPPRREHGRLALLLGHGRRPRQRLAGPRRTRRHLDISCG